MLEDMQVRNSSPHTQSTYVLQISLFARHFGKPPDQLGSEDIRTYQVYLTNEKKRAPASILIAVSALRFLYDVTLHKDWTVEDIIPTPKGTPETAHRSQPGRGFLSCVPSPKHQTILTTCYVAGLRVSEAVRLKPTDAQACIFRTTARAGRRRAHYPTAPRSSELGYHGPLPTDRHQ
jgi:site-specific recombinase XerD